MVEGRPQIQMKSQDELTEKVTFKQRLEEVREQAVGPLGWREWPVRSFKSAARLAVEGLWSEAWSVVASEERGAVRSVASGRAWQLL